MAKKRKAESGKASTDVKIDLGLGGIFKGVTSLLDLVTKLAEEAPSEIRRETTEEIRRAGGKPIKAVYGVSVRMGLGGGKPTVETFGNVHEEAGKGPVVDEVREPMVDVFDEADHILVVAELPGVEEGDISHEIRGDVLTLSAETAERSYHKELLLPCAIAQGRTESAYKNGILELKLWKRQKR